ncbi:MAG: hypothetical protein MJK04_03745 [Psychrosphaera sp.]|nr:hypothetical protein [Psychrosphaera sp.]NQZ09098.1 excinuclease ATPase subunit [Algicola sp.]
MDIGSSFSSGLQGYQQASNQITQDTLNINRQALAEPTEEPQQQEVAQPPPPPPQSLESSVVNLTSELGNAQANVRSIETADEVLGSIIDLRV